MRSPVDRASDVVHEYLVPFYSTDPLSVERASGDARLWQAQSASSLAQSTFSGTVPDQLEATVTDTGRASMLAPSLCKVQTIL